MRQLIERESDVRKRKTQNIILKYDFVLDFIKYFSNLLIHITNQMFHIVSPSD